MNRNSLAGVFAAWTGLMMSASVLSAGSAWASNDCGNYVLRDAKGNVQNEERFRDKSLFVNLDGRWMLIKDVRSLAEYTDARRYSFVYLVRGDAGDRGVMVVKAGEDAADQSSTDRRQVRLTRDRTERGTCGNVKSAFDGIVSGSSYDKYHDRGFERTGLFSRILGRKGDAPRFDEDVKKIKQFHVAYERKTRAARKPCAFTDDIGNGNRAKFSFDESVSGTGRLYSKVNVFKTAYAGEKMQLRQVYMAPYSLNDSSALCLPFRLTVKNTTVLRILDLER